MNWDYVTAYDMKIDIYEKTDFGGIYITPKLIVRNMNKILYLNLGLYTEIRDTDEGIDSSNRDYYFKGIWK